MRGHSNGFSPYAAARIHYQESLILAGEVGKDIIVSSLEGLASIIAVQGPPAWAARLWGSAEMLRETMGTPIPPIERPSYEQSVDGARAQLGEQLFATAWVEGRTMTLEQVLAAQGPVALPMSTLAKPASTSPAKTPPLYPDGLTTREVEVLCLVAQGLTDVQVAEQLVISPRTVNTHLKSIYGKIQVSSRSAATRYAMKHQLV